jgi:hypothetical protein
LFGKGCCAGRDRNRQEGVHTDFRQHQFRREQHAADWGVEGRRDAGPCASCDQGNALTGLHLDDLTKGGTERGTDLYDRTLPPNGGASADRDG